MTYGWAILIIAVVLIALFQLGIFGSSTSIPRAPPGSCEVFKNSAEISLAGECNNNPPQYVMQFNGQDSYINLGNSVAFSPEAGSQGQMTLCIWYDVLSLTSYHGFLLKGRTSPSNGNFWEYAIGQASNQVFSVWNASGINILDAELATPPINQWNQACLTYNHQASQAFVYVNGVQYSGTYTSGYMATAGTGNLILGVGENGYSNVQLANFQLYNTSLSQNEITALYDEGIGGHPLAISNLVGWWPLNGDVNDYSGNNHDGQATNIIYTGSLSGYVQP